jgi:hypothetical protein
MQFSVEKEQNRLYSLTVSFPFFFICASPAVAYSSLVSMLKSDQGAFPLRVFTSDEEPTTFFVVEGDADA